MSRVARPALLAAFRCFCYSFRSFVIIARSFHQVLLSSTTTTLHLQYEYSDTLFLLQPAICSQHCFALLSLCTGTLSLVCCCCCCCTASFAAAAAFACCILRRLLLLLLLLRLLAVFCVVCLLPPFSWMARVPFATPAVEQEPPTNRIDDRQERRHGQEGRHYRGEQKPTTNDARGLVFPLWRSCAVTSRFVSDAIYRRFLSLIRHALSTQHPSFPPADCYGGSVQHTERNHRSDDSGCFERGVFLCLQQRPAVGGGITTTRCTAASSPC